MKQRTYAVCTSLLVIALLLTTGVSCGGRGEESLPKGLTTENFAARVQDAAQNLETYTFDMEMTFRIKGVGDGEAMDTTISAKADGAADEKHRAVRMEMASSAKGKFGDETIDEATKTTTYVVGDRAYVGTSDERGKMKWVTQRVASNVWEEQQVEKQIELLKNSKIKLLKSEKVNRVQSYVVEIEPDLEMLWDTVMQQPGMEKFPLSPQQLKDATKKLTVKYWFAKDTFFLKKVYVYWEMGLTPEMFGEEGVGQAKWIIELTLAIDKHDENVDIEVPAEAKR